ncbi:Hsp20 family protein [Rhizobiaceae bacterium BDR2-2]|uniref:Hsp20 family protein n=1 Tax=Ectorhizobium quercum TaxID=2965071 RepID=A0AAE3MVT2_9HYPH|nr:Hsp20 family protein [Ectorhizobium quercum]MCX8995794.1 Hsp20 family protein [Ectorhizobium quercum]
MAGDATSPFSHPLLIGFDMLEESLRRHMRSNDGYPPYNIERLRNRKSGSDHLRITLAVAGFSEDELDVLTEENRLIVRGRQVERPEADYLHRGIAARQFQRVFLLAEGIEVQGARLRNGLLAIDLVRPENINMVKKINISVSK